MAIKTKIVTMIVDGLTLGNAWGFLMEFWGGIISDHQSGITWVGTMAIAREII